MSNPKDPEAEYPRLFEDLGALYEMKSRRSQFEVKRSPFKMGNRLQSIGWKKR